MDDQFRPGRMLARGLARRCPNCGGGKLFRGWFKMHDACPTCGHCLNREEGFWLGSFAINFAVMEAGMALVFALYIVMEAQDRHPSTSRWILYGLLEAVLVPLVFYPFSKTVWAAIDLVMHRGKPDVEDEVIRGRREAAARRRAAARSASLGE
jgi:uncharacterized protein (DUF983 family)